MKQVQRDALRVFGQDNTGAALINGRWVWPDHIRKSVDTALEVIEWGARKWEVEGGA